MYFYFLTIDRAESKLRFKPTKEMYYNVFNKIKKINKMEYTNEKYPVKCFEWKEKGSVKKKTKCFDWLHFHCIVKCMNKINYKECNIKTS